LDEEPRWETLLAPLGAEVVAPVPPARRRAAPGTIIERAMRAAGLVRFLREARHDGGPVTVVVNDPHRGTDTRRALDALMRVAAGAGGPVRFRLLVATGSHVFGAGSRRRHEERVLGPWRGRFVERLWHDARDARSLVRVAGVRLHRWVAEGTSIGIGSLEPHYFAGVAGAHKSLTIGVMALNDIEANHARALSARSRPLALEGNPIHEGIAALLRRLEASRGRLFAVDEIQCGGRVVACMAGRPLAALAAGLPLVRRIFTRSLRRPVDLVVARVGPPLDRSLYQADKGIKNVEAAVRDGGTILLDAPCPEGVGIDRFLRLLARAGDYAAAIAVLRAEGYTLGDHKAVRLRRLTGTRRVRLGVVSRSLPEEAARILHASRFDDRTSAAAWAVRTLGAERPGVPVRGLIVEDAGNMALRIRERESRPRRKVRVEPRAAGRGTSRPEWGSGLR